MGKIESLKLTNVSSLDHTEIVPSITDATYTFLGIFPDNSSDISFLGRRTPASDHSREFGSNLDASVREQGKTKLDGWVSIATPRYGSNPDLEGFSVDDKTTIQFLL